MVTARALGLRMLSLGLVLAASATVSEAGKPAIPAQKAVDDLPATLLFEAIEASQIDVKLVHKDESTGNLFVENKTEKPLNVQMPEAFVGVHVLNQGFFGNGANGFSNSNGTNPFGIQTGQGNGQNQGGQTTGGSGSNTGLSGTSIFSVPPGEIVRIPIRSVCLEHGRPTPSSRMEYRIFPVERFSDDPALFELLTTVASENTSQKVAQAAAWHLASDKSWKQLAAMKFRRAGNLPDTPHFMQSELDSARRLAESVQQLAEKKNLAEDGSAVAAAAVARNEAGAR